MAGATVLVIDDSPTILKVVQLVLAKAGYQVVTAADGDEGVEAAKEHTPDLILLDFVMPRMNGYQVCRALQDEQELADTPIVLMSAKGDQVGDRFVKVMGIVDYITKPFSPEAITGVVEHTLTKHAGGKHGSDEHGGDEHGGDEHDGDEHDEHSPDDEHEGDEDGGGRQDGSEELSRPQEPLLPEPDPEELVDAAEAEMQARRAALGKLREGLSKSAAQAVLEAAEADGVTLEAGKLEAWLADGLTTTLLEVLLGELRAAAPELTGSDDAVLTGDLRVVPLAEVLLLLAEQEQTGGLTVTRGSAEVELFFRAGSIELATAAGVDEEFLLGRFIVAANMMTQEDLDLFLKSRAGATKLLGHQLVKLGYITEDKLHDAMRQQSSELVYELMRWNFGRFTFRTSTDLASVAAEASLALSVEGLLMEGFRRVDEWHLIERELDNFDQVYLRNDDALAQMGRGRLTREELAVLELVNGKNTIKEIVRQSRMGSFEVSKMLFRLLSVKLIRKRVQPMAV